MTETSSSSGRKRAKVDGPLASSSSSSRKFDGAVQFKSKFQPSWAKQCPFIIAVPRSPTEFRCTMATKFAAVLLKGNLM